MPRFAANLTMLFTEYPLLERFDRAAAAGFQAVEFLFPYDEDIAAIRAALDRNGLQQVLFNLPAGNFAAGERGFANDPGRIPEFREGVARALEIARELDCPKLNCLVGLTLEDVPLDIQWQTVIENLRYAATEAEKAGVLQIFEPLNTFDTPGFLLSTTAQALMLLNEVQRDNLKIQYDVYHAQRMEGNICGTLERYLPQIGHIQIADSPARNEPGTGELNYPFIFDHLDRIGYDGWVSLEYRPSTTTGESLGWMKEFASRG
jgi:hydroxypyruvate isomerase